MANNTQVGFKVTAALTGTRLTHTVPRRRTILSRFGGWLFAAADNEASWWGWEVHERWLGLARRYRDPRFDQRAKHADHGSESPAVGGD
jgi:hypothetical protein